MLIPNHQWLYVPPAGTKGKAQFQCKSAEGFADAQRRWLFFCFFCVLGGSSQVVSRAIVITYNPPIYILYIYIYVYTLYIYICTHIWRIIPLSWWFISILISQFYNVMYIYIHNGITPLNWNLLTRVVNHLLSGMIFVSTTSLMGISYRIVHAAKAPAGHLSGVLSRQVSRF